MFWRKSLPFWVLPIFALQFCISEVHGGSPCPPRSDIYPCFCSAISQSRRSTYTVVSCSRVVSTDSLSMIFDSLKKMQIDRLILVDSFLEMPKFFGKEVDDQQRLPQNWFSDLRIHEMEIIDSQLSPCFACQFSDVCRNVIQTHISVVNSSRSGTICTVCEVGTLKFSWIACLSRLKYFDFRSNQVESVESDFFPVLMKDLIEVNMSSNMIRRLGRDAFKNLPALVKLDLSHNSIRDIPDQLFGGLIAKLKFLDLSYNQIISISPFILKTTVYLQFLLLQNNLIEKLDERTWKHLSPKLLVLNISDNLIMCDCCINWLNSSLHTWTQVLGKCAFPLEYNKSPVRRASRLLTKQCANNQTSNNKLRLC